MLVIRYEFISCIYLILLFDHLLGLFEEPIALLLMILLRQFLVERLQMSFIGIWVYNLLIDLLDMLFLHEVVLYCPQKLLAFLLVDYGLVLFVDYLPVFLHFVDFEFVGLAQ